MINRKKYLIVDGSNYLFSSYLGVPQTAVYKDRKVNAVYGFFAKLKRVSENLKPADIIVLFDSETGIQTKVEVKPEYKATRVLNDIGMFVQLPIIKRVLELCNIKWIEPLEYEADDVIGSLAKYFSKDNEVYISSNDFDFAQLLTNSITLVRYIRGEIIHLTERDFLKEWGFEPENYKDYLALKGDSSDNILGVKGVGYKTARSLIERYSTVEGVIQNLDSISTSTASKIVPEIERLRSNLKFLTIDTTLTEFSNEILQSERIFDNETFLKSRTRDLLDRVLE